MEFSNGVKQRVDDLLVAFRERKQPFNPRKLLFEGVGKRDVYNITAPFYDEGELIIAGRVEERDSEQSQVIFFTEKNGKWYPRTNTLTYNLQDPFVTFIGGELIFGGTETFPHPDISNRICWRTKFYRGKNINSLAEFLNGPDKMKDVRLVELKDKRIGVFSRPQGEKGGRGKIGFGIVNTLEEITSEVINNLPLLEQFYDDEWGGANEIHLLNSGNLGILGHIAKYSMGIVRHYYPMTFILNPHTMEHTEMKIIGERNNFIKGDAKREDLVDVLFSGGLTRDDAGNFTLYCGVSDAESQCITIEDPFSY